MNTTQSSSVQEAQDYELHLVSLKQASTQLVSPNSSLPDPTPSPHKVESMLPSGNFPVIQLT
jgi:hypothetical protein